MATNGRYVQTLRGTLRTLQNFYRLKRETLTSEMSIHISQGWGASHFIKI